MCQSDVVSEAESDGKRQKWQKEQIVPTLIGESASIQHLFLCDERWIVLKGTQER